MRDRQYRGRLTARLGWLRTAAQLALILILAGYARVQVVEGSYYREMAESNRLRKLAIQAPRGLIVDRDRRALVENVPSYVLTLDRSISRDLDESVAFAAQILGSDSGELGEILAEAKSTPSFQPVLIAEDLTLQQIARFSVAQLEHPEFGVEVEHLRLYRHAHQTAHVLGYVGEASRNQVASGLYKAGDRVGKKAVERVYDDVLRGVDGEQVVVVDSRGRVIEDEERSAALPGEDLVLTLDLRLQQTAARLLEDKVGAIVALDPKTGDVLAMASSPSFDPNLFARELRREDWRALVDHPDHPLQNRALQNQYPPGSIFKIVLALAGLEEGVITPETTVTCTGSTTIYNHRYRCWKPGGHGRVDLHAAIRGSCNNYFHELGRDLGIDAIARYAKLLGLGSPTGIEVGEEKPGLVPTEIWSREVRGQPWYPGETISVAIGQGPILVTPLQMAAFISRVAAGGRAVRPRLALRTPVAVGPAPAEISRESFEIVRRGLWGVVNEDKGTARQARVEGHDVAGKTGTAQVIAHARRLETEEQAEEFRTHAWFASFAPVDDPQLAVAIFLEHGGAGSSAAAPLAKVLYEKFFESDLAHRTAQ